MSSRPRDNEANLVLRPIRLPAPLEGWGPDLRMGPDRLKIHLDHLQIDPTIFSEEVREEAAGKDTLDIFRKVLEWNKSVPLSI